MVEGIEGFRVEIGVDSLSETGGAVDYNAEGGLGGPDRAHHADQSRRRFAGRRISSAARQRERPARSRSSPTRPRSSCTCSSAAASPRPDTRTPRPTSSAARRMGPYQRRFQAPRLRVHRSPAQRRRPEDDAMTRTPSRSERGAALVVGLIMLVLITVMLHRRAEPRHCEFPVRQQHAVPRGSHRGLQPRDRGGHRVGFHRTRRLRRISTWIPITTAPSTTSSISRCRSASRRPSPRNSRRAKRSWAPTPFRSFHLEYGLGHRGVGGPGRQCRRCGGGRARRSAEAAHADRSGITGVHD